ncbi:DUF4232 domain-containing protein [Actinoplanes sp. NPDC049596]|uniref:DUF4232 domain-containing protein n=1 Tax=unclassified Actinoplanes TaxID=2626549 RepID=UPI00343EDE39
MRKAILAAGAAGLVIALGGCGSGGDSSAAPAATPSSAAPDTTTAPTTAPTAAPATSSAAPAVKACLSRNLEVTDEADEGGGAAGHHGELLVFANKGDGACTLYGYPGVSFVAGDQGKQVGSAFTRTPGTKKTVTLEPGDKARATILIADYLNVDAAACKPVQVRGYRVYPPNETASVFVAKPQTACSAPNEAAGQVQPVQ